MNTRRTLRMAAASAVLVAGLVVPSTAAAGPLRGWWPMNERSGQTVRDWSGNGNHGTLGSTPAADDNDPTWIKGIFNLGSALRFDGNDYVSIPDAPELRPERLTVSAWIRKTGPAQRFEYFVAKGADSCFSASWGLYTTENALLSFYVYHGDTRWVRAPEAPAEVFDGRWHHVAGTYDGTTVRLFVDGRQIGTGTPTNEPIDYDVPSPAIALGSYQGSCALYLTGDVDGVSIWDRALPIAEIGNLVRSIIGR
jgi:concanavalin A-like lectin/glucanase superfamily protein